MDLGRSNLPGAMGEPEALEIQPGKEVEGRRELRLARRSEMGAADDGINRRFAQPVQKMADGVDQSGVSAAKQDDQPFGGFDGQRRIIPKSIGNQVFRICSESDQVRIAGFGSRDPGDLAAEMNSGRQSRQFMMQAEPGAGIFQSLPVAGQADEATLMLPLPVALLKNIRVSMDRSRADLDQKIEQPAGMIVVTVTQDHGIDRCRVDTQRSQVGQQGLPLAGVEQQGLSLVFDETGEAVFAEGWNRPAHGVFTDNA